MSLSFTVYYQDKKTFETKVWSHSAQPGLKDHGQAGRTSHAACWLDDEIICATNSSGYIGLWRQGLGNWDKLEKREQVPAQQSTGVRTPVRSSSSAAS